MVRRDPGSANSALFHLAKDKTFKFVSSVLRRKAQAMCNAILLFQMSTKVVITYVNFKELPKTSFMSMHHRMPLHHLECFAQFIFAGHFKNQKVLTALTRVFENGPFGDFLENLLNKASNYIFGSLTITPCKNSQERYWAIAQGVKEGECLSVFPCRESSQYFGDSEFYFRDGLFAASIFRQLPILDFVMIEPTATKDYTTIDVLQFTPPQHNSETVTNADEYKIWRIKNYQIIHDYTQKCESEHKARKASVEAECASCYAIDKNGFCEASHVVEYDIRRNRSYPVWRDEQLAQAKASSKLMH